MVANQTVTIAARLVVVDIGEVLVRDGAIPPEIAAAVRRVETAGHHLALVSQRSLAGTGSVIRQLGLSRGRVICSGATVVASFTHQDVQVEDVITFDPAPALRHVAAMRPTVRTACEVVGRGYYVTAPFPERALDGRQPVARAREDVWTRPTPHAVVHGVSVSELTEQVNRFGVAVTARDWLHPGDWLDLRPTHASMAAALETARTQVRVVAGRTTYIGQDADAVRWAGRRVVTSDAAESVQTTADEVLDPSDTNSLVDELDSVSAVRVFTPTGAPR
ncbi:hypothetical protein GCM10027059_41490 [Myceligenerans halotolerans]